MVTELLCRLQGIDKWPSTTAETTSIEGVSTGGKSGMTQDIYFSYRPHNDEIQSGKLFVDSYASLYGLKEGDTFDIQYNPLHPARFYSNEAKSLSSEIRLIITIVGAVLAAVVLLAAFFGQRAHSI